MLTCQSREHVFLSIHNEKFPSNWELSSARASCVVRYLINRFNFNPSLFSAIGYADTRPLEESFSSSDPKNRRVEILILKNSYNNSYENKGRTVLSLSKKEQDKIQQKRLDIINQVEKDSLSPAAKQLIEENKKIMIERQKSEKLSSKNMKLYTELEKEDLKNKPEDMPAIEKRVVKLKTNIPEDEDFGL